MGNMEMYRTKKLKHSRIRRRSLASLYDFLVFPEADFLLLRSATIYYGIYYGGRGYFRARPRPHRCAALPPKAAQLIKSGLCRVLGVLGSPEYGTKVIDQRPRLR